MPHALPCVTIGARADVSVEGTDMQQQRLCDNEYACFCAVLAKLAVGCIRAHCAHVRALLTARAR